MAGSARFTSGKKGIYLEGEMGGKAVPKKKQAE